MQDFTLSFYGILKQVAHGGVKQWHSPQSPLLNLTGGQPENT
jgi:hypothetical protein